MNNRFQTMNQAPVINMVRFLHSKRSALSVSLCVQSVFEGTTTKSRDISQEGKRGSYNGLRLGSSWNNDGLPKARSLYGMNVKAVSSANQSKTHLSHREQPGTCPWQSVGEQRPGNGVCAIWPKVKKRKWNAEGRESEIGSLKLGAQAKSMVRFLRSKRSALRMPLCVKPIFGGTTKEGKRGTCPWQSVGEQRESEIGSLKLGAQPIFGGTTKEGKRGTYDV
ncbi:hypothetical protein MNBD_GAMMA02-543 [hydrothermal vent metagenome]|uniref:Uncharacterized protein n=1 Tax=hydrothermal vent metagenome TaxID=652676 RepID=A0A3B0W6W8_9ZZZZ